MIDIPPRTLILTVFLTGAAAGDSYSGKIRNYWILPACIAGLLNGINAPGVYSGFLSYFPKGAMKIFPWNFMQFLLTLAVLFPLWYIRALGAGDIKTLAALALWFPMKEFWRCVFASFVISAAIGAARIAAENVRSAETCSARPGKLHTIHFALPILISFLLHLGGAF